VRILQQNHALLTCEWCCDRLVSGEEGAAKEEEEEEEETCSEYEPVECEVDVIWMAADLLEVSWIHDMLQGCSIREHVNTIPAHSKNLLFVVNRGVVGRVFKLPGFSALANVSSIKVGLIHLGDEAGLDDVSFYPQFEFVFRNYWFQKVV
jgi:hypothetical protein